MTEGYYIERIVRIIAGAFVIVSLIPDHIHSPTWLWLSGFAGLNLLQPGFTKVCPSFSTLASPGMTCRPQRCGNR